MRPIIGPPATLVKADRKVVIFRATDKSWSLTMTRQKWADEGRPEYLYALPHFTPEPDA